jgi:hypothetical protein
MVKFGKEKPLTPGAFGSALDRQRGTQGDSKTRETGGRRV